MFECVVDKHITMKAPRQGLSHELFKLTDKNRKHLRKWLPWVDGTKSPQDTLDFVQVTLEAGAKGNMIQAAILYKGKIAGMFGTHIINHANKNVALGYWLAEKYEGKGIITKCCAAFLDYLFFDLKLERVEIHAAVGNKKSRAIPERLGFTLEGIRRHAEFVNGKFLDLASYAMLAKEWKKQGKKKSSGKNGPKHPR